jgi:hypothetical protein
MLFHRLVDCGSILGAHFVEFIDARGSSIGEDEGAGFEGKAFGVWIAEHGSG